MLITVLLLDNIRVHCSGTFSRRFNKQIQIYFISGCSKNFGMLSVISRFIIK